MERKRLPGTDLPVDREGASLVRWKGSGHADDNTPSTFFLPLLENRDAGILPGNGVGTPSDPRGESLFGFLLVTADIEISPREFRHRR